MMVAFHVYASCASPCPLSDWAGYALRQGILGSESLDGSLSGGYKTGKHLLARLNDSPLTAS